jgi:predicted nucleotidyltransferase
MYFLALPHALADPQSVGLLTGMEINMEKNIIQELVDGLHDIMEDKLVSIILYGSVARGTATEESDVDIAILIRGSLDKYKEDRLSDFIVDMNLEHDKVFSVIDIDYDTFCTWEKNMPFYNNVSKEGIVLWKAA